METLLLTTETLLLYQVYTKEQSRNCIFWFDSQSCAARIYAPLSFCRTTTHTRVFEPDDERQIGEQIFTARFVLLTFGQLLLHLIDCAPTCYLGLEMCRKY